MKTNKKVNILTRQWGSLSDLKEYLEKNTSVKILDFNGWMLKTSDGTFTLSPEGLKKEV